MTQIWHKSNLNRLDKVNKVHEKTLMEALEIEITDIGNDYVQGTMPVLSLIHISEPTRPY